MGAGYRIPGEVVERELEVKKSRFIARALPAASREQALAALAEARREHPQAGHHCWAYLLGDPGSASSAAMNDDGEPSGTAGKPILNVIQHKAIGDVMVVVIRYFGGVKLGAGGLTRAYAGAAEAVLSALPLAEHRELLSARLTLDFADQQPLRLWAEQHGAQLTQVDYGPQVAVRLELDEAAWPALEEFCGPRGLRPERN